MDQIQSRYRRKLITSGVSLVASMALPVLAASPRLTVTPRQTAGPFYPTGIPADSDNDLVRVAGQASRASGQVTHVFGRVLDARGRPVARARVEIWQCDTFGHYHHLNDRGGLAEPQFQGFGRMTTAEDGAFHFRTIRPVAYPGRTPHIHFLVAGPGFEAFTTQMYIAGEARNQADFLLNSVSDPLARASLLVQLKAADDLERDSLAGVFDIVLG